MRHLTRAAGVALALVGLVLLARCVYSVGSYFTNDENDSGGLIIVLFVGFFGLPGAALLWCGQHLIRAPRRSGGAPLT